MFKKIFNSLLDDDKKKLKKYEQIAENVLAKANELTQLTDDELRGKTADMRQQIVDGKTLDDVLVDAFATVMVASTRVLKMTPFKVQIMGAINIAHGNISEMKTGEGKTLTSTMPAYLHALTGRGVHVVTVNEYLAKRDAEEMGQLFEFLGLTVGLNLAGTSDNEKREAYAKDITYSTNNELGFDYLRDNMAIYKEKKVQRGLYFAIIDEVDSILIDESRTPLIISGKTKQSEAIYTSADNIAKMLVENTHFTIDLKSKTVNLTKDGIDHVEKTLNIENLYDVDNSMLAHSINNALKANYTLFKEVDYVIDSGEIKLVDQFTGRIMEGRALSDGLHQAIEAKENIQTRDQTRTVATITFQNYFRLYEILSGMTGTAKTEAEEFRELYYMEVLEIPTNQDVIRDDKNDIVFATIDAKVKKIIEVVKAKHEKGQPVLIGTVAIETSEMLSHKLHKAGLKHEVLNAKNHAREAEIIANAGQIKAITIATNMAGRGTDIKISEEVKALGGLAIVGTERHDSRRIDNQLRGRSGRQGDPGDSQFFVSFEDDLLKRFASDKIKGMLQTLGIDDEPIDNKIITRSVENAQKKVENNNYDVRKMLLKYDNVIREQRELIYEQRDIILEGEHPEKIGIEITKRYVLGQVEYLCQFSENREAELKSFFTSRVCNEFDDNILKQSDAEVLKYAELKIEENVANKFALIENEHVVREFFRTVMLKSIDEEWILHIDEMQKLREAVGLRGYAQVNPFQEYATEGHQMYEAMISTIEEKISNIINKGQIRVNVERQSVLKDTKAQAVNNKKEKKAPIRNESKVGRNEPCPCGSGKKYKRCCGNN